MKNKKSVLTAIVSFVLAVTIVLGTSIDASALIAQAQKAYDTQGYGSFDEGLIPPISNYSWYHPSIKGMEDIGCPNLDFEKGLEYWTTHEGVAPTEYVKLRQESNGNHYIELTPKEGYDEIVTVKFPFNKLKPGDTPGLLYKWRGDSPAMQVVLEQQYNTDLEESGGEYLRIGHDGSRGSKNIWTADEDNEDEWNIQLSINVKPVQASTSENPVSYYHVMAESTGDPEISSGIHIDDIQIVIHNDATQKVYDLDGNLLYDLNNLPKAEVVDYIFPDDLPEKDERSKLKVDIDSLLDGSENLDDIATEPTDDEKETSLGVWLWVIIAAAVVLLLAAGVIVFIIIKKKKANATTENKDEELTEVQEKTDE